MREIKFRAWYKNRTMLYGIERIATEDGEPIALNDIPNLMQFTGLRDKNGKEIYEGDFLRNGNNTTCYEVLWSHGDCGFVLRTTKGVHFGNPHQIENREVIGNIYENPDLLK